MPTSSPFGLPFADEERQPAIDGGEAARLHDVGDEIGAHLGEPAPQHPQAFGRDVGADDRDQQRADDA